MGLLYWRSFTHWLGGMGVLVFLLAITSFGGGEGHSLHLLRAESPGPDVGKITPEIAPGRFNFVCHLYRFEHNRSYSAFMRRHAAV